LFEHALEAVSKGDPMTCDHVIAADDEVDRYYLDIERRILDLFALQSPVASDLRLLTAMLHVNLHLERVSDMGVNIAKICKLSVGLPRNDTVLKHLGEMGRLARGMLTTAMQAFASRDLQLCYSLPKMDDPIDRLNRGMLSEILETSEDKGMLEWGIRMYVVSRQIERVGDHAVDIGEQVAFLVTGDFHEFSDASHPELGFVPEPDFPPA
ncbi:MAG: phosphate signaling complex protein PhoU, partial [Actinomycetota bacterium]